jgi:threonine/homoserine/homoserine lactone efflux protein
VVSEGQLLSFALASFVLIVIPGPSVLFVVGRALAFGRRTALGSVLGNAVGVYVVGALTALGVGTIVQRSELVFTIVRLVGAVYLVWLGISALRHRRKLSSVVDEAAGSSPNNWRAVREGFVVGIANPKVFILFASILPQFVNRSSGNVAGQMLLLSLVSFAIALVSDSAWGIAASQVRAWFEASPRRLELVGGAGGLAIIGLGVTVGITGRRS